MTARLTAILRYPVKGFSPERLDEVDLRAGETIPWDRAFAVENGPSGFDPAAPRHLPKQLFFCLMKNAELAKVTTHFEEATLRLVVRERDGAIAFDDTLATDPGRAAFAAFVAHRFSDQVRGEPKTLASPGHSFSDVSKKVLHLVGLDTLRALEAKIGAPLDPVRFRPNLVVEGLPAYAELDWQPGHRITIGSVAFEMVKRTERCAATTVNPETALRDLQIPKFLMKTLGHTDCGVYLRSLADGRIGVGDALSA